MTKIGKKRSGCNCIKSDVCGHYSNIRSAFSGITEIRFGGWSDPAFDKLTLLIEKTCKFREQNKKRKARVEKKYAEQFKDIKEIPISEFKGLNIGDIKKKTTRKK